MRCCLFLLLVAILAMVATGCEPSQKRVVDTSALSQWIGTTVRVQFRRDALGAAADLPISPKTGEINGAATSIVGKLVAVYETSIVVEESERPKWIPREVILFVENSP